MRISLILATLAATTATAAAQPAPQPYPAPQPGPAPQPQPYYQPPQPGYMPPPPPTGPRREGFTSELSLGFGFTSVSTDNGSDSYGGLSGLNIGLGGWISPRTALTVRIAGNSFERFDVQFISGLLGISAQHMVSDAAWLGGGLGIGVLTTDQAGDEGEGGLGLDLRAGYNFHQSARNAFSVSVEVIPVFVDDLRVTGVGFQLGWQHL